MPAPVRKQVLRFDVAGVTKRPATITVTYLTKGMAWAPNYRIDASAPDSLRIAQYAVLKNELADISDAEVQLISGFPSIEFSHVVSPFSLRTNWASFFRQLSQCLQAPGGRLDVTLQQVASNVAMGGEFWPDLAAMPTGEGPDIYYHPAGRLSLGVGESLAMEVAHATAGYKRVVDWLIPDTRQADGRFVDTYERERNPELYDESAWDALEFHNPFPFPMTTAPACITAGDRFLGERISYWANPGELTRVRVTKALSIRTRCVDCEEPVARETVYIAERSYQKALVTGTITVRNNRNEEVEMLVRRRFSGELISADGDPECRLLEEGLQSVNRRNELVWRFGLGPGETREITYRHSVLVRVS